MQDAECGMQKLTHSQQRADRVPMQDAGAECKSSPNIGRRGQKKSRTECTMQVRNTESHPRVHCVCREGLYGADALYTDCVLHATCLAAAAFPLLVARRAAWLRRQAARAASSAGSSVFGPMPVADKVHGMARQTQHPRELAACACKS